METATNITAKGTKVTGTYMAVPFEGTVTEARWHTISCETLQVHVELSSPIEVYGSTRTSVLVSVDIAGNPVQYDGYSCSLKAAGI